MINRVLGVCFFSVKFSDRLGTQDPGNASMAVLRCFKGIFDWSLEFLDSVLEILECHSGYYLDV